MWNFQPCKPELGPGIMDFCPSRALARARSQGTRSSKETEKRHLQDERHPPVCPRVGEAPEVPWQWDGGRTRHTYSLWLERGLDLLALQLVPVDVAEERVLLDVPLPLRAAAQALGGVLGHQLETGERKQSRGVQLLPKMSPLRSPQGAVFPSWTSQDVSHQGPISSRCLWDSKERTLRKKLE